MNTLFFIGNGFDINLGLKTRYSQFYEYYKSIDSPSEIIRNLKNDIENDIDTWFDLEATLGKYSAKCATGDEFICVNDDIVQYLKEYLKDQEEKFDYSVFSQGILQDHLSEPENLLRQTEIDLIRDFKTTIKESPHTTDIISFNYTSSIAKILRRSPPIQLSRETALITIN